MNAYSLTSKDVALIIPVHNRTDLLHRAIASAMAGTARPAEIIVVDDCSDEDTEEGIREWKDQVRYCRLDRNVGAAAARNIGARRTNGKLLAFLDSDDEWLPTKLESQLEELNRTGADACYCPVMGHDGRGETLIHAQFDGHLLRPLLRSGNVVVGGFSSLLVMREAFERVGGLEDSLRSRQDYDLHLRLSVTGRTYCRSEACGVRFQLSGGDRITQNERARISGILQCFRRHRRLFLDDRMSRWPTDLAEAARRLVRIRKYHTARKVLARAAYLIALQGNLKASNYSQLAKAAFRTARKTDSRPAGAPRGVPRKWKKLPITTY